MIESIANGATQFWYVWIVGLLLVAIAVGFIARFVIPARRIGKELGQTLEVLKKIKTRSAGVIVELDEIAREAMSTSGLVHLWHEYAETLHPQRTIDEVGQAKIVSWRHTALAETFFTERAIVDTPLKTEFYKHLPGILTGLGIIGTFVGLMLGLTYFDYTDAARAQEELKKLMGAVAHAFYVSATAITMAMLFIWIEKSLVTALYRKVEQLCQTVDGLFDAGASEEYLERLVTASETNATQATHIKDALVADLKQILTGLAAQQVEASARHANQMSVDVGKVIADSLGGPIEKISAAVERVGANQGEAVNKMLTDVLASFSAQMQDMFGGQMRGMTDLLRETSTAMRETATRFGQLAVDMDSAGKGAVEAMGERLNHAITSMEARQQVMNRQMGEFVEQIRALVSESQTKASQKLQETLATLGEQVAGVVGELQVQARAAATSQQEQTERIARHAGDAVSSLSGQVEALIAQSLDASRALQTSVDSLSKATTDAIAGMNSGAETLFVAASDFAKAGQGVTETMNASVAAVENIRNASQMLSTAAGSVRDVFGEYAKTRDAFALMVSDLKSTVENAKREASLTSEIVAKLQAATGQLATAQRQSEEYLKGVSEVLVKAHESFQENVERTLREGNRQFQNELRQAVDLLSGAIKDLGDTLDDLPPRK